MIASQSAMKIVGQLGQILGPKGLMPSPKNGTITDNIGQAVKEAKSGKVLFKNDKGGIIHGCIAKVSFDENQVSENLNVLIDEVKRLNQPSTKGVYIKDIFISSTMGRIKVECRRLYISFELLRLRLLTNSQPSKTVGAKA